MIRVLFVCLGNICRSPMAEAVFRKKVAEAGLSKKFEIDSAGTGHWHIGNPPHSGTIAELQGHGLSTPHLARQIVKSDLLGYDYILAMDRDNMGEIRRLGPASGSVKLFLDYAPQIGLQEVPDPYHDGRFALVYELVERAAEGLLASIRAERNL